MCFKTFSAPFGRGSTQTVDQHVPDDAELFDNIMAATKYDKRVPPKGDNGKPVSVKTSIYVYFLGRFEEDRLEFETQLMIRHRWTDSRLRFRNANISAGQIWFYENIEGEDWFSDKIWTPNIFIENEQSSELTKLLRNNIFVRISRSGDVQMNYRVSAKVLCNMALHRFPHDRQGCSLKLESWTLNANDLILEWERANPLEINDFILPEYALISYNTQQQISCYSETFPSPRFPMMGFSSSRDVFRDTSMCSPTSKNYSRIQVNFVLQRQVGHYFLDYYIPSILLVAMSWVSFWLHPSAVPGRTTLEPAVVVEGKVLEGDGSHQDLPLALQDQVLDLDIEESEILALNGESVAHGPHDHASGSEDSEDLLEGGGHDLARGKSTRHEDDIVALWNNVSISPSLSPGSRPGLDEWEETSKISTFLGKFNLRKALQSLEWPVYCPTMTKSSSD
eukprot:snap_masked-scaffold770_size100439-processed-gene-0.9 protein:Tk05391 transcript:snap_masked-scaffold770_size100439-processed-gene-0.9-mRNA-1 annotation:"glycine receptor subunit alphaz1-like"